MDIDDRLKGLIKELGDAINDALSHSVDINDAIQNVRNAGYDVELALEATIGFKKKPDDTAAPSISKTMPAEGKLKITSQDLKFLQSLKISIEDLNVR